MRDPGGIPPSSVRSARRLAPGVATLVLVSALGLVEALPAAAQQPAGTAAFAVQVTNEDGAPISGARVLAQPSEAGSVAAPPAVETDELGQAVVGGLVDGEWFVEVSHPAYMLFAAYLEVRAGRKPQVGFSSQVNTETSWKPMTVKFFKASPAARRGAATRQRAEPAPPEVVRETVEKPVEQPEPPKVVRPEPAPDSDEAPSAVVEAEAGTRPAEPRVDSVDAGSPREVTVEAPAATAEPEPAQQREEPSIARAAVSESEAPIPEVVATEPTPPAEPTAAQSVEPLVERPAAQPAEPARAEPAATEPPAGRVLEVEGEAEAVAEIEPPSAGPAVELEAPGRQPAPEVPSLTEPAATPSSIEAEPAATEPPSEAVAHAASKIPSEAVEEHPLEPTEKTSPRAAEPIPAPSPPTDETAAEAEPPSGAVEEPEPGSETGDRSPTPEPAVAVPEPPATPRATPPSLPRFLRSAAAGTCPECEPGEWAVAAEQEAARAGESRAAQQCSEEFVDGAARAVRLLADADAPRLESYAGPLLTAMWRLDPTGRDAVEDLLGPRTDPSSHCQLAGVVLPDGAQFTGYVIEAWDVLGGRACLADFDCAVGQSRWLGEPEVVVGNERTVVYGIFKNRSTRRERRARMTIYFRPPSETWRPAAR